MGNLCPRDVYTISTLKLEMDKQNDIFRLNALSNSVTLNCSTGLFVDMQTSTNK